MANEAEIAALKNHFDCDLQDIFEMGVRSIALHRGDEGASLLRSDGRVDVDAFPVTVLNPTGTGDVFNAGFVAARLSGHDDTGALRYGCACGGFHMEHPENPYPTAADIQGRFGVPLVPTPGDTPPTAPS